MNISDSLVFRLLQSNDEYPIDFDDAWKWLGFSRKDSAKRHFLSCGFVEGVDYVILHLTVESDNHVGLSPQEKAVLQNKKDIKLAIDCFKSWAMMAGTSQGKKVRLYFLECEKRLKQLLSANTDKLIKERIVNAIVSACVVDSKPKFEDWFYGMLYRKRGNGWENKSTKDRPACVGTWTNKVVYDRMFGGEQDWGVKAKLLESEPKVNGRRKNPLHSHFSDDYGIDYLRNHFSILEALDTVTPDGDWEHFMYTVEKALPIEGEQIQLNLLYEIERIERRKVS